MNAETVNRISEKVLVACPTYSGKAYCLREYLDAFTALVWPDRHLFLVDNTRDNGEYAAEVLTLGVEIEHIHPAATFQTTFREAWNRILDRAIELKADWIWSLEQDVICEPLTLDALLNVANYTKAPYVSHTYPFHFGMPAYYARMGCTLMSVPFVQVAAASWNGQAKYVEEAIAMATAKCSHVVLHQFCQVRHLDGPTVAYQFQEDPEDGRIKTPEQLVEEMKP